MKYKLIKCYPGSPKLGTIITRETTTGQLINGKWNYQMELFPEFWEPVVEKEYEILSLINKYEGRILTDKANIKSFIKYLPFNGDWDIHCIKRLSDGEIFKIGDQWKDDSGIHTIKKIFLDTKSKLCCGTNYQSDGYRERYIENVIKVKKPLFITEDGVEIFEGDKHWTINKDLSGSPCVENTYKTLPSNNELWFSTREAAVEYILMNKSCLSVNDILEFIHKQGYQETLTNVLKKLAKQKQSN